MLIFSVFFALDHLCVFLLSSLSISLLVEQLIIVGSFLVNKLRSSFHLLIFLGCQEAFPIATVDQGACRSLAWAVDPMAVEPMAADHNLTQATSRKPVAIHNPGRAVSHKLMAVRNPRVQLVGHNPVVVRNPLAGQEACHILLAAMAVKAYRIRQAIVAYRTHQAAKVIRAFHIHQAAGAIMAFRIQKEPLVRAFRRILVVAGHKLASLANPQVTKLAMLKPGELSGSTA